LRERAASVAAAAVATIWGYGSGGGSRQQLLSALSQLPGREYWQPFLEHCTRSANAEVLSHLGDRNYA